MALDVRKIGLLSLLWMCFVAFGVMLVATSTGFTDIGYETIQGVINGTDTSASGCTRTACYYDIYAIVLYDTNQLCYIQTATNIVNVTSWLIKTQEEYPNGEMLTVYRKDRTTTCRLHQVGDGKAIAGVVLLIISALMVCTLPLYVKYLKSDILLEKIAPSSTKSTKTTEYASTA